MNLKLAFKWVGLVILIFALVWITLHQASHDQGGSNLGKASPEFKLQNLNGEWKTHKDFEHNLWIVSFWASWCEPCVEEMPGMEVLYQAYKEKGLVVLGINVEDYNAIGKIQLFVKQNNINFPILRDPFGEAAKGFRIGSSIPHNFIVDQHGKIIFEEIKEVPFPSFKASTGEYYAASDVEDISRVVAPRPKSNTRSFYVVIPEYLHGEKSLNPYTGDPTEKIKVEARKKFSAISAKISQKAA